MYVQFSPTYLKLQFQVGEKLNRTTSGIRFRLHCGNWFLLIHSTVIYSFIDDR